MPGTYNPNELNTVYLQVLRLSGAPPTFPGDYTTPQIRILHYDSGVVEDVAFTSMTQVSDNIWRYDYTIPGSPFFGNYFVEFSATLDGIGVEASDEFKVVPVPDIIEQGQGSCEVSDTVLDEGTSQPIPGTTVLVFPDGDLNNAVASDITDSNGSFTVYLNPGSYKIRYTRVGYIDETHDLIVNSNCTFDISGD